MLLDPHSRFFLSHELQFRPHYGHGEPLKFIGQNGEMDVRTILQNAYDADTARMTLRNDDVFRLTRFQVDEARNVAVLMFRRGDPKATTQVYEHRHTGVLRNADKTADDLVVVSAHLFVHLTPMPGVTPRYRAIVEEVPGVSKTYMLQLISDLVRAVRYQYDPGRGEPKETYTLVSLDGVKAERMGEASAADGDIEFVELVRAPEVEGLDTHGMIPREQRMKVKIKPETVDKLGVVQRIRNWANDHNWPELKVRIALPHDRSRLVTVARGADAADVLFVRAKRVTLIDPLPACSDNISEELLQKALEEFAA